jgi:SAM-dependent methyltransferase
VRHGFGFRQRPVMKVLYSAKEYWSSLADTFGTADAEGFSPVLHPGTPAWFNATIDRLQNEAWSKSLARCGIAPSSSVLDVGCGTGRWLARYQKRQLLPVGLDATAGMLKRAASRNLSCPLVVAVAQRLPFRDQTFSFVSAVTVIQHIPPSEQRESLQEMARVLKPGGHLLLIDLIRGDGPHIFPRSPSSWIAEASSAGLSLVEWYGQEYFFVDRTFVKFTHTLRGLVKPKSAPALPVQPEDFAGPVKPRSAAKALYWVARKITCKASEWLEPLARSVCPNEWATHGLFLFRK